MARALDKLSPDERMTFLKGMTLLEARNRCASPVAVLSRCNIP